MTFIPYNYIQMTQTAKAWQTARPLQVTLTHLCHNTWLIIAAKDASPKYSANEV